MKRLIKQLKSLRKLRNLQETTDKMLHDFYEGVNSFSDKFYILLKEPIRRHRQKCNSERLRTKLPNMLLSGYSIICSERDDYCDMTSCTYKTREEDVIEGCCKCGLFQIVVEDKYKKDEEV